MTASDSSRQTHPTLTQPHPYSHTELSMSESTIRADAPLVTLINVFIVDPADQQRLVEHWQQATDDVMRHLPGFISANLHRSLDGTKVVNYAQWESQDAFQAMLQSPEARTHLKQIAEIGAAAPVLCEVVSVHRPPTPPRP
jgi:quinol monooxygenase YgiN